MSRKLHIGTFDSESYWRDGNLARLPAIDDKDGKNIVNAMDELLFPMTGHNDTLITRFKMDNTLADYLHSLGFRFIHTGKSPGESIDIAGQNKCIFQLLTETKENYNLAGHDEGSISLAPYSVLPYTKKMCERYGISKDFVNFEVVAKVNSKVYSYSAGEKAGIINKGVVVRNTEELTVQSTRLLEKGAFLIKDAYGVSGKGNLLISSEGVLNRIIRYIERQEKQGYEALFILEPFLDKALDFSCQMRIEADGGNEIISIQKLDNNAFAFQGSYTSEEEFIDFLSERKYFECMERIAKELYFDGYTGNVCIDSMMLADGEIVPVVEINARKSMGLINYYIDQYLSRYSLSGNLFFFSTGVPGSLSFEMLFEELKKEGLLFEAGLMEGIIPLSANTMFINKDLDNAANEHKSYKGRMYISAVGKRREVKIELIHKTKELLLRNNIKVYN